MTSSLTNACADCAEEGGGGSRRNSEETAVKGRRNSVYLGGYLALRD